MDRRHGRRTLDPDAPVVDLDRVLADDLQIDLIGRRPWPAAGPAGALRSPGAHRAAGRHHRLATDEQVFELLDEWRLDLAGRPLPELRMSVPSDPPRSTATGRRRRSWRPVLAVAAAIGAVLVGSAAVGAANADPRSPLWPITQIIRPAHAQSIESTEQIRIALDEARTALAAGRGQDARRAIVRAAGELGNLEDAAAQDSIRSTMNGLWVRSRPPVAGRSTLLPPAGTVPPGSPALPAGPTAGFAPPATDAVDPTPAESAVVRPAVAVPGLPAGSSAGATPSGSTPAPISAIVAEPGDPAPPIAPVPPTAPATPVVPMTPATVPDPAAIVVPSAPEQPSAPAVTQQSAPTPSRTGDSGSAGPSAAEVLSGTDGGGVQPSVAVADALIAGLAGSG